MAQTLPTRQFSLKIWIGLSIIPAALFISSLVLTAMHGPYYLRRNFDPEYAYLLNSLNILLGEAPGHTDHPGTSVQILGAVVVGVQYGLARMLGITGDGLVTAVLTHPESYLRSINLFLNLLLTAGCFLVGYRVFRYSGRWLFVIILQIVPFLFLTTLMATTRVMPEPFLLFITYGLVFFLLPLIFKQTYRVQTTRESIFLGFILGLGVVTKVTFVPLVLLLWLPNTLKRKVYAFLSMIITFFLITLPIWNRYPIMVQWLIKLAIHNGRYGRGEVGIGNADTLSQNLSGLIMSEPTYFALIGLLLLGAASLFWHRQKIEATTGRRHYFLMLALFMTILLGQTAITVKHPPIHYALPSMGLAGFILLLLITAPMTISVKETKWIRYGVLVFLMGAMGIMVVKTNERLISAQESIASVENIETLVIDSYAHCAVAAYYRNSSVTHALDFGDSFANRNFSQALERMYINNLFYGILAQRFHTFTTFFEKSEMETGLANGACVLLQGTPFADGYEKHATSLLLERLDDNISGEALYLLVGFKDTGN